MKTMLVMVLAAAGVLGGCAVQEPTRSTAAAGGDARPTQNSARLEELAGFMTGSFSSEAQSNEDESYMDIRLHMARLWAERRDGVWLYVEQAAAKTLEKPYRQRVYRLTAVDEGTFKSEVFELPGDVKAYAGAWNDTGKLAGVTPETLRARDGCALTLKWKEGPSYAGATGAQTCASTLNGASYALSEAVITKDLLISWDRGFDAKGAQVWGAAKGGYRFVKLAE